MTTSSYENYTDLMWLEDMLLNGHVGPFAPLDFKPARDRLFYFDHDSPDFFVMPMMTRIGYEEEESYGQATAKVEFDGTTLTYSLNSCRKAEMAAQIKAKHPPAAYWRLFCSHLQLSIYTAKYGFPEGGMFLDFGDHPAPSIEAPVLAYCTPKDTDFCVVDPFFIVSKAYFRLQSELEKNQIPFADKQDKVFWRGSASGVRTHFWESQRYLLCSQMQGSKYRDQLDFGIIDTPQMHLDKLVAKFGEIPEFARPAPRVSPDTFSHYRYGVDVDGNSNSWGGFFTKMLSRAYLIRVASMGGYRQWYFPRLEAQELYSIVAPDLSNFDDVLDQVFALSLNEISDRAQGLFDFASSMTVYDEIARNNAELHAWLNRDTSQG